MAARRKASRSSRFARVTSRATVRTPTISPVSERTGEADSVTSIELAGPGPPHGREMLDAKPGARLRAQVLLFGVAFLGNDERDRTADGFGGAVAEHPLGSHVPAR